MSSIEAIGESAIQSVDESVERDEEKVDKGLAFDTATQTHLNSVKTAKNSMITTFKIMKIVIKTLRETSDSNKEMNKLLKKEWETVSNKQSENNRAAKDNLESSGRWNYASLVGSQAKLVFDKAAFPVAAFLLQKGDGISAGKII